MKKSMSILFSCAMLATLVACGDNHKTKTSSNPQTTTEQQTTTVKEGKGSNGYSQQYHLEEYSDLPLYRVQMKDGQLIPPTLYVPARQKFRIYIENIGTKPGEFESHQLRQEKVLYMGAHTTLLVLPLDPGEYDYFDDFTPGPKGKIVAK